MTAHFSTTLFLLAWLTLPLMATAQGEPTGESTGHHRHHLSFFTGATTALGEAHTFSNQATWFTAGFDYEYRIARPLGISVFTEYLFAPEEEFLFGLPVFVHPCRGWKFNAAPLLALVREAPAKDAGSDEPGHWQKEYGFRLEGGYDFSFGHYTITPIINYDRVDGHGELNYGIAVGSGF